MAPKFDPNEVKVVFLRHLVGQYLTRFCLLFVSLMVELPQTEPEISGSVELFLPVTGPECLSGHAWAVRPASFPFRFRTVRR